MAMEHGGVQAARQGTSARAGLLSLRLWATRFCLLGAVLWLCVATVEASFPTTNATRGRVAHSQDDLGFLSRGSDSLVVTERPLAPPDELVAPQAVGVAPPGPTEAITGVRFQPIQVVSWKVHPRQPALRGVQWMRAVITTGDLNTGRGTSDITRQYVRSLGADIRPPTTPGGDQTGHLVAERLGGTGKKLWSVFPQLKDVNNGEFKRYEAGAAAKVVQFGRIEYYIRMKYNPPGVQWPLRPKGYSAAYCWVENNVVKWYGEAFPN